MVEKEVKIKVTTEADAQQLEDMGTKLEESQEKADALGQSLDNASESAGQLGETGSQSLDEVGSSADETSDSLDNATDSSDNLNGSLENVNGESLIGASADADSLGDSLENASANAEQLSDSMGLIESTMVMDMANQVGALGDSAEGMAQEMNQASITVGQLATNVGMAEPQMVSLINNISNKTFPQEEAMAYVNALNQMGVSADKLGESATNMDRINDATGVGYQTVMDLTAGLRSMGITADNLPASFNAIAYAEDKVYDGVGTLQQVLKTQAGTINEYGLSIDQVVVVLSTLQSQTGLTGRRLSSELGTRLKDCNGDIGALEQSLGLANGTLANASSLTDEYAGKIQTLADEEAEHKTFIDELNAGWEDMQLLLAPVLSPISSFLGLLGQFGQTALAINSLITLAETFGILKTANLALIPSQIAEGFAGWFSIGWIAVAILLGLALGYALVWLYNNCDWFREAVDALGQALQGFAQFIYSSVIGALDWLKQKLEDLWNYVMTLGGLLPANVDLTGNKIVDSILRVMLFILTLPMQLAMIFTNIIAKTLGFGDNFAQRMIQSAMRAVQGFLSYIRRLPQIVMDEFNRVLGLVNDFINSLPQRVWEMGVAIIDALKRALGIGSPGHMYYMFEGELERIDDLPEDKSYSITRNVSLLGQKMVSAFGSANINSGFDNMDTSDIGNNNLIGSSKNNNATGKGDVYNTFNIDYLAKKEFVQDIIDIIKNEIYWDNETAGRTV